MANIQPRAQTGGHTSDELLNHPPHIIIALLPPKTSRHGGARRPSHMFISTGPAFEEGTGHMTRCVSAAKCIVTLALMPELRGFLGTFIYFLRERETVRQPFVERIWGVSSLSMCVSTSRSGFHPLRGAFSAGLHSQPKESNMHHRS